MKGLASLILGHYMVATKDSRQKRATFHVKHDAQVDARLANDTPKYGVLNVYMEHVAGCSRNQRRRRLPCA